jgi:tetratricopeptide (TPR) repeat protein
MKSSKEKGQPNHRDGPPGPMRPVWVLLALTSAAALVALALFLTRDDPQALMRQGEALLERDPQQAAQLLERSVTLAGGDLPQAQLLLCEALGRQGRWIEALGCFSLIKDKSAGDGRRLMQLSADAFAAGELILAEQALQAARQTSLSEAEVLTAQIPVRLALGYEEQALADCRRLAVLAPEVALPHLAEARLLRRQRDVLAAEAAYRAALARSGDSAESATIRRELVELLIQQSNAVEARREFDQLGDSPVGNHDLTLLQAYILRLEQRSRDALDQVARHLADHSDHVDALLLRGTLHFDLGEYELAAAALRRLTELEPYHKEAHYVLGQSYLKLHQAERARSHLSISQKLAAAMEEINTLEGEAAENRNDKTTLLRLADLYDAIGRADLGARSRQAAASIRAD